MSAATAVLPDALYRAASVRRLDRAAIDDAGIPGVTLMQRAGEAAWLVLRRRWPAARRIAVMCGAGNNGGDGYVIARLAHADGCEVQLVQVGDVRRLGPDAALHARAAADAGLAPRALDAAALGGLDVVVDALLGIGLDREVGGDYRRAIDAIDAARVPVLAVDVPSGLNADTGMPMGAAVVAAATVTFIGVKQGLLTGRAADHRGELWFADLDVPAQVYGRVAADARVADLARERSALAPRARSGHKGDHGHVLVIGGDLGYAGAARMSAQAAARTGAGLVSLATHPEHAALAAIAQPEIMARGVADRHGLQVLARRATVVALGPGLGTDAWGESLFGAALDLELPLVLDADALNLLARAPLRRDDWVLTPHPGEAARLLGVATAAVQADRFAAAAAIQARYGGVCVLKGAGSLIAAGDGPPAVCVHGNPGMASGGMGDVLTGVIAALRAQRLDASAAARLGVCLHAAAADAAALRDGERGLLATDLFPHLRRLVNGG
ncbi:MAG: NAD(P)H-hydrate dehydratase [Gammaproteobacteria bacterium]